jgi:anti-sigma regulatory factor (Ser/Thr protein kinase)
MLKLNYIVQGGDYSSAGDASSSVKKALKQLGLDPAVIRKVAIAMYEAEINMIIHANGGEAYCNVTPERVEVILKDNGPGIPDVALAMKEGYSTASEEARNLGFGAGMGLPNIAKYTDTLDIDTKVGVGTSVTFTVKL